MEHLNSPAIPHQSMFTAEVSTTGGIVEKAVEDSNMQYSQCMIVADPGDQISPVVPIEKDVLHDDSGTSTKPREKKEKMVLQSLTSIVLDILNTNDRIHKLPIKIDDDGLLEFLISKASEKQIKALLKSLYITWTYKTGNDDSLRRFLPEKAWKAYSTGSELMFTLTRNNQLRCWYGTPSGMNSEYVDSCGNNLLFGIEAFRDSGGYVIKEIMSELSLNESDCERHNGVKVWNPVHLPSEKA